MIRTLESINEKGLARLLDRIDSRSLESAIGLEILCDFLDKTLEGNLSDEEFGASPVAFDISDGNSYIASVNESRPT